MNESIESESTNQFHALRGRYPAIWIWSLLTAAVIVLFTASGVGLVAGPLVAPSRGLAGLNLGTIMNFAWLASVLVRGSLVVAFLFLLRFLRNHILPSMFSSHPAIPIATFTTTGAPAGEPPPAEEPATPDDVEGARLLWHAGVAIAVALAIPIITGIFAGLFALAL